MPSTRTSPPSPAQHTSSVYGCAAVHSTTSVCVDFAARTTGAALENKRTPLRHGDTTSCEAPENVGCLMKAPAAEDSSVNQMRRSVARAESLPMAAAGTNPCVST
eukprot:CAMPEP_0184731232 /NCGR_PEP_ID=MMETSP0314-20130426/50263_1 /TAXON_ID=38298 /ORGANISM="Rhodella maculata, Strain CCMP 736" /LENGTH=104 /DNA_ID=CAMNT_0027197571 /DNA_START=206 /DNA_END=516 /DNA_ORIENTATION=+